MDKFNLDVSLVARLGGHSAPALTVTLEMVKRIAGKSTRREFTKARVTELIMSGGACLMNVWISARRSGDEDEDVFVFLLTGATSLYGGEIIGIVPVPPVRLQAGDVQRHLDGGAGFAILVPAFAPWPGEPLCHLSTQDTFRGALSQGRHEDRQE